jgi:hypothetical protein
MMDTTEFVRLDTLLRLREDAVLPAAYGAQDRFASEKFALPAL